MVVEGIDNKGYWNQKYNAIEIIYSYERIIWTNDDHLNLSSFNISKLVGIFNGFDESMPISYVLHLLLNLWAWNVTQRALPQKLIWDDSHYLTVSLIQPESFQALDSIFLNFLLVSHVVYKVCNFRDGILGVANCFKQPVEIFRVLQDEGEDSLYVVFRNVFGLVVTTFVRLDLFNCNLWPLCSHNIFILFGWGS